MRFEIYRDAWLLDTISDSSTTTYFDINSEVGTAEYAVRAIYEHLNEVCESEIVSVTVDVTSVLENSETASLYPNPASDHFKVESQVKEIKVFDALGQMVYEGQTNEVEVRNWNNGVYFVRIVDENDVVSTVKFIKE